MDEISLMIDTIINHELDDLILDLVYDIHSSIKGIPEDQLDLINNGAVRTSKQLNNTFLSFQTTPIDKQTCRCPHCGQSNIIAIRFAYHLAKCLGKFFLSETIPYVYLSFQVSVDVLLVKQNIRLLIRLFPMIADRMVMMLDHILIQHRVQAILIDKLIMNISKISMMKMKMIGNLRRKNARMPFGRIYPRRKRRKFSLHNLCQILISIIVSFHWINSGKFIRRIFNREEFVRCFSPQTPHVNGEMIYLPKSCSIRSPLNLVEDEQSSTTSIIMFQDDDQQ